jgi:carboxymethylenebutenolidase
MLGQLNCPLFGVFGVEDQNPPVALEAELKKRAGAAGKNVSTKVYDGAGHAFLADYRPSYREGPAFQLWGDILVYFDKHLRG